VFGRAVEFGSGQRLPDGGLGVDQLTSLPVRASYRVVARRTGTTAPAPAVGGGPFSFSSSARGLAGGARREAETGPRPSPSG